MKNDKHKNHTRIPNNDSNFAIESEHNNNTHKSNNGELQEKNLEISTNTEDQNIINKNKTKFYLYLKIGFVVFILVCFAIIFPFTYKPNNNSENEQINSSITDNSGNQNNNTLNSIFETNDYYLLDKTIRKNRVFTQGLFFDTNNTLIESGGLYGKSILRRFNLNSPDVNIFNTNVDNKYFAEGACLYQDKYIFQLTWREQTM